MSDISANIVVQPFDINISMEDPALTITPQVIDLTVIAAGGTTGTAGGGVFQLQYNNGSGFGGIPTATYSNGNLALGSVSNLKITGGTNGYVLQTDGTGNLGWTAMTGGGGNGAPGGSNTQIQFNDGGLFGGVSNLTFDKTTNVMTLTGNLIASNANLGNLASANFFSGNGGPLSSLTGANVTGYVPNAIHANSSTISGTVTTNAQPNITSVGTLASLSVTGNISSGNANLGNIATANYFVGSGNGLSNVTASLFANGTSNVAIATANGNVTIAVNANNKVTVSSTGMTVVGNVTANNFSGNLSATTALIGTANITTLNWSPTGTSIAIGNSASANTTGGTSLGYSTVSGQYGTALGYNAEADIRGVSVGYNAGSSGAHGLDTTYVGANAGKTANVNEYDGSSYFGAYAGERVDGAYTIGIGYGAGQGIYANSVVALGQASGGIAIGQYAARTNQKSNAIAIGTSAGSNNQGTSSIAIGALAAGNASVAQANNSIVINATGATLDATTANALFIKPIRTVNSTAGLNQLYYDSTTGEIVVYVP